MLVERAANACPASTTPGGMAAASTVAASATASELPPAGATPPGAAGSGSRQRVPTAKPTNTAIPKMIQPRARWLTPRPHSLLVQWATITIT